MYHLYTMEPYHIHSWDGFGGVDFAE